MILKGSILWIADVMKIARKLELEVEPGDVIGFLQSRDKT